MIETERREISLLKAFGYGNAAIAAHYAGFALTMTSIGVVGGWVAGLALGRWDTQLYTEFFRFPFLAFRPGLTEFVVSGLVSWAAALAGALGAVRRAVALQPAEAMRPPVPPRHGGSLLPDGLVRRLDHPTRIMLRQIARSPGRAVSTVMGVSLAIGVMIMALQWQDAIDRLATSHFIDTQHQTASIGFFEPRAMTARLAIARLPGVMTAEPARAVPVDLMAGRSRHRGVLTGLARDTVLEVIHDVRGWDSPVPRGGVVLGDMLARKLGVRPGDTLKVRVHDGARPTLHLPVAGLIETCVGMPAYIDLAVLNRALGEGSVLDYANVRFDSAQEAAFLAALKTIPGLAYVTLQRRARVQIDETLGETIMIFSGFFMAFAGALAIGVLYNAVRVSLSERARELSTLRIVGFRRGEIAYILIGEAALLTLIALPTGCITGYGLIWLLGQSFETELFRLPLVTERDVYGRAVLFICVAAAVSAVIVRRRLDRLDLVAVLKTRE